MRVRRPSRAWAWRKAGYKQLEEVDRSGVGHDYLVGLCAEQGVAILAPMRSGASNQPSFQLRIRRSPHCSVSRSLREGQRGVRQAAQGVAVYIDQAGVGVGEVAAEVRQRVDGVERLGIGQVSAHW